MADADVHGMLVRIEATTAQMRQEIARGEASVAQAAGKIDSSLGQVDKAFDRTEANASVLQKAVGSAFTGIGIAAAASVAGLIAITAKTTEYAQEVKNLAALSNTSVTDFQRLAAGAKTVGIEQEKLSDIFKDTNDRVGEFIQRGGGEMADFFKEIAPRVGVTAQQFAKLSGPEALQLYYNSLEKAGLSQQQMTTYMESMADEATGLIPLLKNNGEGFKQFGDMAEKTGRILSTFEVDRLVQANVAIKNLEGSAEGAGRQLVVGLLPSIESVTQRLTDMANNGALETLGSAVGFLVEHFNVLAVVMGGKVAASFAGYLTNLAASTAASIQARTANIAQAASSVEVALANQQAAQTAVFRAEKEAVAARATAVQTQMSLQLAEARLAERAATAQVAVAQAGLRAASGGVLALMGGPAGLAALAVGAGIAFLTMSSNAKEAGASLEDLKRPIAELRKEFQALTKDQQQATIVTALRQQEQAASEAGDAYTDFLKTSRQVLGSTVGTRIAGEFEAARNSGKGFSDTLDDIQKRFHVPEQGMRSLREAAGQVSTLDVKTGQLKERVSAYRQELGATVKPTQDKTEADRVANEAASTYLGTLDQQLTKLKDKTAIEQANTFITENKIPVEGALAAKILERAKAIDAQKAADKKATEATNDATAATKKAATEEEARHKALTDLKAQADIAIRSATGLADAYLAGTDKTREFALQQKVEEALLKTGASARTEVVSRLKEQMDAQDRLAISKTAYDLQKETTDLIAQAKATLMGTDALEAYNVQKAMQVALAGKNIEVGSKEYQQLLDATKAQQEAVKVAKQASDAGSIMDRLYPQSKLLKDYTEDQKALNAAMGLYPEHAAQYQQALVKLGNEYELNRSKATLWGQMTEGAIDRVDSSFADAWANIGSGANKLWDNLKQGFKQTLGEIAHMLTTKPLLASISNWLTGTDNGQGLSSVWGKLLGDTGAGQSSASGGGLVGSITSLGSSVYKLYSAVTGVGADVAAGYAQGGISGALSGGVNYYGNLLSNLSSTVSSGLSSLGSAIFGASASQIAANTATSAVLNTTLSQSVTQLGTQFAANVGYEAIGTQLASGFTAQVTGQAATTAAASAAAGGISSGLMAQMAAMASNPVGWVVAAVTSAYQSGKLYDQGERWNTKEVMNTDLVKYSGGVGQATLAPLAVTNNVLEKLVGGKLAAIFSGSVFASTMIKAVSSKIFGGSWQTKDGGISLGVTDGDFSALQYTDQKKKGGLFSSNKKRTRYGALDTDLGDALGNAYNSKVLDSLGLFAQLGVQLSDSVLDGLNVAAAKISTKGKTNEAIQAELDAWFTSLGDSAVAAINTATAAGLDGYTFDGIVSFIGNLYSVNSVLEKLGVRMLDTSVSGGKAVESLVAMAGSLDDLNTGMSNFYEAFTGDIQQSVDTLAAVRKEFAQFGLVLPDTEEGFKTVVQALDLSTAAGQNMFVQLTGHATDAATAYGILKQRQSDYYSAFYSESENTARTIKDTTEQIKGLGVTLPGTREEFRALVEAAASDTSAGGKAMYDALMSVAGLAGTAFDALESQAASAAAATEAAAKALSDALNLAVTDSFSAVQRAVAAQQKAATTAYNARVNSLNDMLSTSSSRVSDLTSLSTSLNNALKSLRGTSDDTVKMLRAQATATLQSALASARAGGSLAGFSGLEDALDTVGSNNTNLYASLEDLNRDQGRTTAIVSQLEALNGKQLSNAEKSVKALQDQLDQAKTAYEAQTAQFDEQLAYAQSQLDALNGVDTSVLSVADAVNRMNSAVVAALAGQASGAAATNTYDNNVALLRSVYQAVLGRDLDGMGQATWTAALANGSVTYDNLVQTIATGGRLNGESVKIPGYASGGTFGGGLRLVGENGPELEVTGPSKIFNADQTAAMLSGNSGQDTASEVRQLRAELKSALFAIAKNTMKSAKNTDLLPQKLEQELYA